MGDRQKYIIWETEKKEWQQQKKRKKERKHSTCTCSYKSTLNLQLRTIQLKIAHPVQNYLHELGNCIEMTMPLHISTNYNVTINQTVQFELIYFVHIKLYEKLDSSRNQVI